MKTFIIMYILVLLTTVASAEVYSWEDSEAIHFTDNPASVPEKYRAMAIKETPAQTGNTAPPAGIEMTEQNRPAITHQNQPAVHQANPERQRQPAKSVNKQKTSASAASTMIDKESFPSLATLVVVLFIVALFLIITWGLTVADIVKSNFITPSIKTAWMLLVILIPLLGMEFYYILGVSQKCISTDYTGKQQLETPARYTERESGNLLRRSPIDYSS